ncbi:hypothetical protein LIER_32155 [Lithospermum erythrorhizon]|uniref:Integrase zinc-binding domain-containing protein n=1 Tax=Lithospermum erythrorhizon TaxID=34254 RepID=A0AAV3RUC5_LITER
MAFEGLKKYLGSPQLLSQPKQGESLQLYLFISDVEVSSALVREAEGYLKNDLLPADKCETKKIQSRSFRFQIYPGELYRKSWDGPLLLCVFVEDIPKALTEVHEGWCRSHVGARSLDIKITQAGYYWPTLVKDTLLYVKKCDVCRRMRNAPQQPTCTLTPVIRSHLLSLVQWTSGGDELDYFQRIKKNLLQSGKSRGSWIEELPTMLWSLRFTPNQATGEAPFSLVYGTEDVLPAEVGPGTYELEDLDGRLILRTWHASKLCKYYV